MKINLNDFKQDVIKRSHSTPVLVDFWAPWCGPCRMLSPVIEKLADRAGESWSLVKINTDQNPDVAAEYHIRAIPTVILFRDGKAVDQFSGFKTEGQLQNWLEEHLQAPA